MPSDDDEDELSHRGFGEIGLAGGPGGEPAALAPTSGRELGGDSFSLMEDDESESNENDNGSVDVNVNSDNSDSEEEARRRLLGPDDDNDEEDSQKESEGVGQPKASKSGPQKDSRRSLTPSESETSPRKRIRICFSPLLPGVSSDSSDEDEVTEIARFPPARRYPKRKIPVRGGGLLPRNKTLIIQLDTDSEKSSEDSEDEILGTPRRSGGKKARVISSSDSDSGQVGQDDEIGKYSVRRGGEKSSSNNGGDSEIEMLVDDDSEGGPKPFPMPILDIREERSDVEDKCDDKDVPTSSFSLIAQEINLHPVIMPDKVVKKTRTRGRRDILPIIPDSGLRLETKRAKHEEEERLERIRKRDEELKVFASQPGFMLDPLAEPPVEVVHAITKDLKDHQKEGIESMWKACFETQSLALSSDGGGCILAHSMGLGKSLQVIALLHTITRNKELGTRFKHALVVCPKIVVPNWREEFKFWQKDIVSTERVPVFVLSRDPRETPHLLRRWQAEGGVGVVHYDLLETRCLPPEDVGVAVQPKTEDAQGADQMTSPAANAHAKATKVILNKDASLYEECICNPGPDVIVLDEGHNLKNMDTLIYKVIARVRTKRKIILTGTPLQNNLEEFYAMMNLIKPDLLGTSREFANRFVNPIENGQFSDSLPGDVEKMKECVCVLTQLLSGCVHRKEASLLSQQLLPKHEYVIMVNLTPLQARMYNEYLASLQPDARNDHWSNWHTFSKIMAHPSIVLPKLPIPQLNDCVQEVEDGSDRKDEGPWYQKLLTEYSAMIDIKSYELGAKLKVLRTILEMCECTNEKVLVFTQFRTTLDKIEDFLEQMHKEHEKDAAARGEVPSSIISQGTWRPGVDYSRIDGKTSVPDRENRISRFNAPGSRMKLFLLGTKSASLGINLIGANRVVVFDATYNPAHDLQGIHRVYRYGQTRECYIYRLVTPHTIEEKVFNNQILKLGLARRVVDKSATERAIAKKIEAETENSMYEKYPDPPPPTSPPSPAILEADRVLAKLAAEHGDLIHSIREHKSLLRDDENLNDEQQKLAMEQYKKEKEKHAGPGVTTKGQTRRTNSQASGKSSKKSGPRGGGEPQKLKTVKTGNPVFQIPQQIWKRAALNLRPLYPNDEKGRVEHRDRLINEGNTVSLYYTMARDKSRKVNERLSAYTVFQECAAVLQEKIKKLGIHASLHYIFTPIADLNHNHSHELDLLERNHSRNDKEADAKDTPTPKEPTASELLQQSNATRTPEAAKVPAKTVVGRKLFVSKPKETLKKAATPGPSTPATTPISTSTVTTIGTGQMTEITNINLTSAVTGHSTRVTVFRGEDGRLQIKGLLPGWRCYQTADGRLQIVRPPNPTPPSRLVLASKQQKAVPKEP